MYVDWIKQMVVWMAGKLYIRLNLAGYGMHCSCPGLLVIAAYGYDELVLDHEWFCVNERKFL